MSVFLDSFFPEADFFTEFERFDRHVDKLRRQGKGVDYITICSPNYLHDSHIRYALRAGANAICEKPLVLNPWNIDALEEIQREYNKRINTILQLRLHPSIIALRERVSKLPKNEVCNVELKYITSRVIGTIAVGRAMLASLEALLPISEFIFSIC